MTAAGCLRRVSFFRVLEIMIWWDRGVNSITSMHCNKTFLTLLGPGTPGEAGKAEAPGQRQARLPPPKCPAT